MRRWLFRLLLLFILGVPPSPHGQVVTPVLLSEHGISIEGQVNADMALQFAIAFPSLKPDRNGSVYVNINSGGGIVEEGRLIAQLIEQSPYRTVCVVTGDAASMAFYILQSCTSRLAVEEATLMTHEPYVTAPPFFPINRHLARLLADHLDVMAVEIGDHCSRRLRIPRQVYDAQVADKDWHMTPEEALLVGAIDAIIPRPAP